MFPDISSSSESGSSEIFFTNFPKLLTFFLPFFLFHIIKFFMFMSCYFFPFSGKPRILSFLFFSFFNVTLLTTDFQIRLLQPTTEKIVLE